MIYAKKNRLDGSGETFDPTTGCTRQRKTAY